MKRNEFETNIINEMKMQIPSFSVNEYMARAAVSAFCAQLNPCATELADIKCAVSEAVTNCIVHAYKNTQGIIYIKVYLCEGGIAKIEIRDRGCGISDIKLARQPLYTTDAENERSGMGFTVMESFTDKVKVASKIGRGTTVTMYKKFKAL